MEGGIPEGHLEVLDRLSDRQRRMMAALGELDSQVELAGFVKTWSELADAVTSSMSGRVDEPDVEELLRRSDTYESLPAFVVNELGVFSTDEPEQIEALLRPARTQWYIAAGRQPAAPAGERTGVREAAPAPAAPEPRYAEVTQWDGDIWTALDTRNRRRVYLRSAGRPGQGDPWSAERPRFQQLGPYGTRHWRGYDMAAGRWMYLAHTGGRPPAEDLPGWTAEAPDTRGAAADETAAPALDEALQGLVDAVRWGDVRLEDLAAPLDHLRTWSATGALGRLGKRAEALDRALDGVGDAASRNEACRAAAGLHAEMERTAARLEAMEDWPAAWEPDRDNAPAQYARMLRLGCKELRGAVRRIARADAGTDSRQAAGRPAGRPAGEVRQSMSQMLNFAWAMGRDGCPSEWFADPLHHAQRLSALPALREGCPDLSTAAQYLAHAVTGFQDQSATGGQYASVLQEVQKLLRRYAERLLCLQDRWPTWPGGADELPQESPMAYATMMRLGWQMLEAERQELFTFVGWEGRVRDPNMPDLKSPGNARLSRARAAVPKRSRPLAPLTLPDLDGLRVFVQAIGEGDWTSEALGHPLAAVDRWRASGRLADGYGDFRDRAADVARIYDRRASYEETYKNAVSGLIGELEAVRVGLGMLGPGWPPEWTAGGAKVPAQSPAVLMHRIDEGKKELRRSVRDLAADLKKEYAAARDRRRAPGRGNERAGEAGGTRAERRRATPPGRHGSRRRRPPTAAESIRRFFFGSER
ncbi:hypothetical protein [Streptomyces sp. NPDC001594]|uniref:hypothetical protein n=1 Tax=Streptomyces sp. NPDC001594 TaxID=3364590 RepID=UPI0036B0FFBE